MDSTVWIVLLLASLRVLLVECVISTKLSRDQLLQIIKSMVIREPTSGRMAQTVSFYGIQPLIAGILAFFLYNLLFWSGRKKIRRLGLPTSEKEFENLKPIIERHTLDSFIPELSYGNPRYTAQLQPSIYQPVYSFPMYNMPYQGHPNLT